MSWTRSCRLCLLLAATTAHADSFNIDFGAPGSPPAATYGAAGSAGEWNVIGVLPAFERAPLVNIEGTATGAAIYMFGGNSLTILQADDPATSGDDAALVDDMLMGLNDPVDVCVWVEGLELGEYEVLTYAITPLEPSRDCRVRVDFANQGEVMIGGAWPGSPLEGVTHARHTVTTETGRIGLHSGLYNGYLQSGINGVQLRPTSVLGVVPAGPGAARFSLRAEPNPAGAAQRIALSGRIGDPGRVTIHDLAGRVVWSGRAQESGASRSCVWAGTDHTGARVAPGVYLARWHDAGGALLATGRLIRVR